jgi:hypothetical protein
MTLRIISGAQTGADVAGLWAAKHFGIQTGGWAPKGFVTLNGYHPEMAETFGIKEHSQVGYRERTIANLSESNVTIVCSEKMSPGTRLTINQCKKLGVPYFLFLLDPSNMEESLNPEHYANDPAIHFRSLKPRISLYDTFTINIAGNSTQNSARIFEFTYKMCSKMFTELGYTSTVPIENWKTYLDKWK